VTSTIVEEGLQCWTEEYCLAHCRGFRVAGPDGPLGYVDAVLFGPEGREPVALVVRGRRRIVVPVGKVVRLRPALELVLVSQSSSTDVTVPRQ
jgi:hypothetical protein